MRAAGGGPAPAIARLLGCFVRSLPVKRHHGGRYARRTRKLRTPQVADAYNLNVVRAAADDLFEVLNGHGDEGKPAADLTRPLRQIKRSGSRSVHPQPDCPPKAPDRVRKILRCRILHNFTLGSQFSTRPAATQFGPPVGWGIQ